MESALRPQRISCQYSYIRSVPGVLKLIQLACALIGVILCAAAPTFSGYVGNRGFFIVVALLGLVVTTFILLMAMLNIQAVCIPERWPLMEMIVCIALAVLFLIAGILVTVIAKYNGVYAAAAFFGFGACAAYLADAINRFRLSRVSPRARHAETHTTTSTTTVTREEPTY